MKRFGRVVVVATELGMAMGLTASGMVVLGLLLGRWLDARFATGSLITLVLLVAGAVVGQAAMYRLAMDSSRRLSAAGAQDTLSSHDTLRRLSLALRVLLAATLPGLAGVALGLWLDRALGTRIAVTLVLACGGLAAGVALSLRLARNPPGP